MEAAKKGFRVRLVNHDGRLLDGVFQTIDDAIAAARKAGFEAAIDDEAGNVVASWSIIGGARVYFEIAR